MRSMNKVVRMVSMTDLNEGETTVGVTPPITIIDFIEFQDGTEIEFQNGVRLEFQT